VLELDFDDPGMMGALQQGMFLAEGKTDEMVQTYLEGDLDGLEEIMIEYMDADYVEFNEALPGSRG